MDKEILVISGGGIKGISVLGAVQALEELNKLSIINTYAGTSIGGIICCMLSIGYSGKELYEFVLSYDLANIKNIDLVNILSKYCVDNGAKLEAFLVEMLKGKDIDSNITLLELYNKTKKRLILTTICLNTPEKPIYLWYKTFPNLPILVALRMTSALIPFYSYVAYNKKMYGDGGYIDNYPMKIFKNKLDKVLGLYIMENIKEMESNEIESSLIRYVGRMFECFRRGININCIKGFEKYTIKINVESINVIDYNIDNEKKKELFNFGYMAVQKYYE
jgi:NTE family protein